MTPAASLLLSCIPKIRSWRWVRAPWLLRPRRLPHLRQPLYPALPPSPPQPPLLRRGLYITAPVVGTFYVAPSPDQPPFVQVGDKVQKGQTVCLMEAMKMMNEVKAPCDCIIEAVLQQDGALVSFGDQLIRYREG